MLRRSFFIVAAVSVAACSTGPGRGDTTGTDAGPHVDLGGPMPGTFQCIDCLSSDDCGGDACIQYGTDVACAPACAADGSCAAGSTCASYSTVSGTVAQVCVPTTPACGTTAEPDAGTIDAGSRPDAGSPTMCGNLIAPSVSACCTCTPGSTDCTANGCFGGWWCNSSTCHCNPAPASCGTPDAGTTGVDAGPPPPPPVGSVSSSGGSVNRLYFAVVGDTRPPVEDDVANYPTPIITREYTDIQALSPRPEFVVATGDYCFATPFRSSAHTQFGLYLGAKAMYSGVSFYAMGNHECTGRTSSNCGPGGTTDGVTMSYTSFLADMLAPIHQSLPYYVIDVNATDGSWTSKIVFAAPNAWSTTQESWLRTTLAVPTTYTFVVDHEPNGTSTPPPGLATLDSIMAASSVTLSIVGHTHTYHHYSGSNEVTIGLGGAPPTGSYDYGFLTVSQLTSGDIEVKLIDYMSGAAEDTFRVHPDGSHAP